MKYIYLILIFCSIQPLLFSQILSGVGGQDDLELNANLKISDSSIFLDPYIRCKTKSQDYKILKNLSFDEADIVDNYGGKLYLQKQVLRTFVNLSVDKMTQEAYDSVRYHDKDSLITLHYGENSLSGVFLNYIFPLEKGSYRIRLEIKYYEKLELRTLYSKWIDFNCSKSYPYL